MNNEKEIPLLLTDFIFFYNTMSEVLAIEGINNEYDEGEWTW